MEDEMITFEEFDALLDCFENPCDAFDYAHFAFKSHLANARNDFSPVVIALSYLGALIDKGHKHETLVYLDECESDCRQDPENEIAISVRGRIMSYRIDMLLICHKWALAEKESLKAFDWMKEHTDFFPESCGSHLDIRRSYVIALRKRRKTKEAVIQEKIIADLEID